MNIKSAKELVAEVITIACLLVVTATSWHLIERPLLKIMRTC